MSQKFIGDERSNTNGPFSVSLGLADHRVVLVEIPIVARSPVPLTDAEEEIAALMLVGATNQEIADRRGTSVNTVKNQVASIFEKVDVHSRTELAQTLVSAEDYE